MNSQELELMKDLLEEKLEDRRLDQKTIDTALNMVLDVKKEIEYNKEMLTNELKQ